MARDILGVLNKLMKVGKIMATTPAWPVLQLGSSGKNVNALQCLLTFHGFSLTIDGSFGSGTQTAVINFQRSKNLTPDGAAGENTLTALIVTVQNGTNNYAARAAQYLLSKFETITVDGAFGNNSTTIARTFQQKMEIPVDGTVGPTTWRYLFGYSAYPSGGGGTPYKDYLGQDVLTTTEVTLLNSNKPFYQAAAQTYGIPWQMLAAIHYREWRLRKSGPSNKNGPYQIWGSTYKVGDYTDAEFQAATNDAAQFIKGKAGSRDLSIADNVKYTFFAYNGAATVYKTQAINLGFSQTQANIGEGSPYVMNRFDARRDPTVEPTKSNNTWGQIKTDGGAIVYPANADYGAFVVYNVL